MTVTSLLLSSNSVFDDVLGTSSGDDGLLYVAGRLTISPSITVNVTPGADWSPGLYTLATFVSLVDNSSGLKVGRFPDAGLGGNFTYTFSKDSHDLSLDVLSVPEPSTFVLLGIPAVGLVGYLRRRKRTRV